MLVVMKNDATEAQVQAVIRQIQKMGYRGVPMPGDASVPPDDGGVIVVDASTGGTISCGQTTCNSSTQVCCVTYSGQSTSESCVGIGQCQNGAALACTSAASCPNGELCCGSFSQTSAGSKCEPSCPTGYGNFQLCDTTAECSQGLTCKLGFGGFKTCRP